MASLLHVLHFLNVPLELPAFVVASNFGDLLTPSPKPADSRPIGRLAVVEIDDQRFDGLYAGIRPLSRCHLAEDLHRLSENPTLLTIAIDFDLSPTRRDTLANEQTCQENLNKVLNTMGSRALLIEPADAQRHAKWMKDREEAGARFAGADVIVHFGMVTSYESGAGNKPHFAERLNEMVCNDGRETIPESCRLPAQESKFFPVVFRDLRYLHAGGAALGIDAKCLQAGPRPGQCPAGQVSHVLVGGTYAAGPSAEDYFLTPMGRKHGVFIHAAIAAKPRHSEPRLVGLLIDLLLGLGIGPATHALWLGYFHQKAGTATSKRSMFRHPRLSYLRLVLIGLIFVGAVLLALFVSIGAMARWGIWISPAGMVVGLMLETFVIGGVKAAVEQHEASTDKAKACVALNGVWLQFLEQLPCITATVVVTLAIAHGLFDFS